MARTGYDSVNIDAIPQDPSAILLGYVDGQWPTWSALRRDRPNKIVLTVATSPNHTAQVLDVEAKNATPEQAPHWVLTQRQLGGEPFVYCSLGIWRQVIQAFHDQGVREPLYLIADYDDNPVIPNDWLQAGCVGKQYRSDTNKDLDYWVFNDFIPGIDQSPVSEEDMDREGWITLVFGLLCGRDPNQSELNSLMNTQQVSDRQVVLAALDSSDGVAIKNTRRAQAGLH